MNTAEVINQDVAELLLEAAAKRNARQVIGSPSISLGWTLEAALSAARRGTSFKLTQFLGQRKLEILTPHGANNFYV